MKVRTLIEFIDAAIDTKFIDGPFDERGGLMLVGPPGSFKSTIIETAADPHPDTIVCSDLNVQQWLKMKDEFVNKRYSALGFPEFEKIYQRHSATASNLEGIIKALIAEGYSIGPSGDPRMPRLKARAMVIGGITTACFEAKYNDWQKNGFLRRFVWILISVQNPDVIIESIRRWERINFGKLTVRPANRTIKVSLSEARSKELERMMKTQPGLHGTAYILMKKIASVLEWKYNGDQKKISELLHDVASSLGKNGDGLFLGE